MKRKGKSIKGLILALATAAVVAPAANGYVYFANSEKSSASYSPQALNAMSDRWTALGQSYQSSASRPDDRAGVRGVTSIQMPDLVQRELIKAQTSSPTVVHVDDRGGLRGPGPVESPSPVVTTSHGSDFDWKDAGIGATASLLAALMFAAATIARRRTGLAV